MARRTGNSRRLRPRQHTVETVDEPGVIEASLEIPRAMRATGLVELEYKRDPAYRGPQVARDINPRPGAGTALARGRGSTSPTFCGSGARKPRAEGARSSWRQVEAS